VPHLPPTLTQPAALLTMALCSRTAVFRRLCVGVAPSSHRRARYVVRVPCVNKPSDPQRPSARVEKSAAQVAADFDNMALLKVSAIFAATTLLLVLQVLRYRQWWRHAAVTLVPACVRPARSSCVSSPQALKVTAQRSRDRSGQPSSGDQELRPPNYDKEQGVATQSSHPVLKMFGIRKRVRKRT
jgi:hypothetical protein